MRAFAVPTITSVSTAVLSVLFFIGLSRVYGDAVLGRIIVIQATAALVQVALIPNSWVYLLGASGPSELSVRYSQGQTIEWVGTACGLVLIAVASSALGYRAPELLLAFGALAVAASSSCLGYLLATGDWTRYVAWVTMPNLIRLPWVWATPALVGAGLMRDLRQEVAAIIGCYFLIPELVRLLAIALPLAVARFRWQGLRRTMAGARKILRNWIFDVGSAVTDQADKLVVGALLGPQVLVAYFFGRRLGGVTAMLTEPVYWERYRRNAARAEFADLKRTWLSGLGAALFVWLFLAGGTGLAILTPPIARYVPGAVVALFGVFTMVMLADALATANRWSRYLAQATGRSGKLLVARLSVFAVFAACLALLAPHSPRWGIVFALLTALACESAVIRRLQRTVPGA